ncbi:AAA family ATPase [Colletotrichum higginsianum]|nr:AAA family ATPase [Colletotrichum higginsianum]
MGWLTFENRQIRNAFQTAIALVEYQDMSKDADEPKPSLGKKQFKSVAQGSREFDDYLYSVLGSTEADGARQDGWRDDGFMASSAPLGYVPLTAVQRPQAAWPPQMKQSGKKEAQISDSDDASDSETDDEDVKEGNKGKKAKGTGSSAAAIETSAVSAAGGGSDMEQFQKFLKFQEMMAKQSA